MYIDIFYNFYLHFWYCNETFSDDIQEYINRLKFIKGRQKPQPYHKKVIFFLSKTHVLASFKMQFCEIMRTERIGGDKNKCE